MRKVLFTPLLKMKKLRYLGVKWLAQIENDGTKSPFKLSDRRAPALIHETWLQGQRTNAFLTHFRKSGVRHMGRRWEKQRVERGHTTAPS